MTVSMGDFVIFYGDEDEEYIAHPLIDQLLATLELQMDFRRIYDDYFSSLQDFVGHTHVFHGRSTTQNILALDLYRDNDQLDLIHMAIIASPSRATRVKYHSRAFFDQSSCPIAYEEAYAPRVGSILDFSRYPLFHVEGNYHQQVNFVQAGLDNLK